MTRDQIEHIRRAARSAQAIRIDPDATVKFTFRAMDIFARLVTPAAVEQVCDEALNGAWEPSKAEILDADQAVIDSDRYRKARHLNIISEQTERIIDLAIERQEGR